jgi:hypothetical protein
MPTRITQVEKPTNAVDVQRTLCPYLFGAQEANALIAMLRCRRRCTHDVDVLSKSCTRYQK